MRYAALYALWPAYNINRQWAEERILYIFERDIRTLSFYGTKNVLFYLYPKYKNIDAKRDRQFLNELIKTNLSRRIVDSFMHLLTESAVSVVDYSDIIIELCENVLSMDSDELQKQWGLTTSISELIITLYDETSNSSITSHKKTAQKCMNLWDVMFERQIGSMRRISEEMMER